MTGRIVILNGAPRAGKSSIAAAIQQSSPDPWLILGVDALAALTRDGQDAVHAHGHYDLEVDTARQTPEQCAQAIRAALDAQKQTAFQHLAERP